MTIQEFIGKRNITMASDQVDSRPDRLDDEWNKTAFHFVCTFAMADRRHRYTISYSMGSGHGKKQGGRIIPPIPDPADVLDSLRSDAQSVDNARDFEEWAGDFGMDTDSRKAHATWELCKEEARKLRHFLGDEAYAELMQCEPM